MNLNFNTNQSPVIIGIDHGYGNIKTAHCCFKTGVSRYEKEPTFKSNLLIYDGSYYLIGEEHKEFAADKILDPDYYILTLAAVTRELNIRKEPSTSAESIGKYVKGDKVTILETKDGWGRTDKGWISMDYVKSN